MKRTGRKREWSIALFSAGLVFLLPPILSIYNSPEVIFGLPAAYIVLYGFWGLLILAMAYGTRRKSSLDSHIDGHLPSKKYPGDS